MAGTSPETGISIYTHTDIKAVSGGGVSGAGVVGAAIAAGGGGGGGTAGTAWSPTKKSTDYVLSVGDTVATNVNASVGRTLYSVVTKLGGIDGKFYFEAHCDVMDGPIYIGVGRDGLSLTIWPGGGGQHIALCSDGSMWKNGAQTTGLCTPWALKDQIGVEVDITNGLIAWYGNGTLLHSDTFSPAYSSNWAISGGGERNSIILMTGDADWAYTPNPLYNHVWI